jgi:hypothetical protein
MTEQWYYAQQGQRRGPVSKDQLKNLASSGTLTLTDLVWKKGMAKWQAASVVEGLFRSEDEPPPLPQSQTPEISKAIAAFGQLRDSIVNGEMTLAKATEITNSFADSMKDELSEEDWRRLKASLSEFLVSCQTMKDAHDQDSTNRVVGVREIEVTRNPVWGAIKRHLPEHMIDTPEQCDRTAWRIGFLCGVAGESVIAQALRKLYRD